MSIFVVMHKKHFVLAALLICSMKPYCQESKPIVVQNFYYPKSGNEEAVYQWRLHASEVRAKLGLPTGRVLKKIMGDALYYIAWECEYASLAAREADVKKIDQSVEFKNVQDHMSTLIQKFERSIWEVNSIPPSSEENQIRQNRLASNAAIAAHDTSGIAQYWTSDILVLTSRNVQNIGKRQNAEAFAKEFKNKQDVIYIRTSEKVELFSTGGMASENGTRIGRWKNGSEQVEVTGTYYAKWIKSGSQWFIRAEVYTPLTCSGDLYCKTFGR